MKHISKIIAILFALSATAVTAQVTNSAVQPFISQLASWATSYNTNLTWTDGLSLDTGIATTTGEQIADRLEIIDNISSFEIGASGDFTGVGSAFNSIQGLAGYSIVNKYDLRVAIELSAGYDFNKTDQHGQKVGAIEVSPGIAAYKMITANTYATVKYEFPVESVGKFNAVGTLYVGAGFTF